MAKGGLTVRVTLDTELFEEMAQMFEDTAVQMRDSISRMRRIMLEQAEKENANDDD